jgi:hypothetical protein
MAKKGKHRTPPRGKNGRFLTKAQRAARRAGHGKGHKGHHKGHAREATPKASKSSEASSRARKAARTRRENEERARKRGQKAARTRARNEREKAERRRKGARARDQLTVQRSGSTSKNWRTGRYPAGHARAGQFKSTRPGSGAVHDNPLLAAAENPLSLAEWLIGGGSLAFGAIVTAVADRFWATTALTDSGTKDANGNEVYTDPGGASGSAYAGMSNAAAVAAPMGVKRWLLAGAGVLGPVLGGSALAYFTHDGWPKTTAFLNFWGLGAFGYVVIKGVTDLGARLLRATSFGQRVFDVEIRAQALKAGTSYTGPTPPSTGLGKTLGGCGDGCGCGPCKSRRNGNGTAPGAQQPPASLQPPAPPSFGPPPNQNQQPTPPVSVQPQQPVSTPRPILNPPAHPGVPPIYSQPAGSPLSAQRRSMAGYPIGIMDWGRRDHDAPAVH